LNGDNHEGAILHGREDIRIERVPVPEAAKGELIVRVGAALTCGTDLKVFRRGYHARMIVPPALFGHELAGHRGSVRRWRHRLQSRRPRGGAELGSCGHCYFCDRGQENLCDDSAFQ